MVKNTFKIASFNVHDWADAQFDENVDRVSELIKKYDPTVIGFQESNSDEILSVQKSCPNMKHLARSGYNYADLLSQVELLDMKSYLAPRDSRRRVKSKIVKFLVGETEIYLTNLHLDYRLEPFRLKELETLKTTLGPIFEDPDAIQIWIGDFNALTKSDYSEEEWEEITRVRRNNKWELPQTELTEAVRDLGLIDCWEKFGSHHPSKTSRFDTRIDYVYATPNLFTKFDISDFKTVTNSDASDHKMIMATFTRKNQFFKTLTNSFK